MCLLDTNYTQLKLKDNDYNPLKNIKIRPGSHLQTNESLYAKREDLIVIHDQIINTKKN